MTKSDEPAGPIFNAAFERTLHFQALTLKFGLPSIGGFAKTILPPGIPPAQKGQTRVAQEEGVEQP